MPNFISATPGAGGLRRLRGPIDSIAFGLAADVFPGAALAGLLAGERLLVATGGGAVLGEANRRLMRERGFVVYLQAGLESQLKRLHRDRSRPLLQRPDREQVLRELARLREPLYREVADLVLDTDGLSAAEAASRLGLQLAQHWTIEGVAA